MVYETAQFVQQLITMIELRPPPLGPFVSANVADMVATPDPDDPVVYEYAGSPKPAVEVGAVM